MTEASTPPHWSIDQARAFVEEKLDIRLCLSQIQAAQALYSGKDVVLNNHAGSGKTLASWIPLFMVLDDGLDKFVFSFTSFEILALQIVDFLGKAGISAIFITKHSVGNGKGKTMKDITKGKYRVVIFHPNRFEAQGGVADQILTIKYIKDRLFYIIVDDVEQVVLDPDQQYYKEWHRLGSLRAYLPQHLPFFVASSVLSPGILSDVQNTLHISSHRGAVMLYSNDLPNVHLGVRELEYPARSYEDLSFLIPEDWIEGMPPPPKFLVFFEDYEHTLAAGKYLRKLLHRALQDKVAWTNPVMSQEFRLEAIEELKSGE